MAVKYAAQVGERFIGELQESDIAKIDRVRGLTDIPGLKHIIHDYPSEKVEEAYRECKKIEDEGYIGELTPEQTVGVGFMYYSKHSLLGDGTGKGKTVQVSGLLSLLDRRGELTRAIVVSDNTAGEQIAKKIIRFTGLCVKDITGKTGKKLQAELRDTDWDRVRVLVIQHSQVTNDTLAGWLAEYTDTATGKSKLYNTFILDESSVVKNPKTGIASYTREYCKQAERVHLLNATPIELSLQDIYTQIDIMQDTILPKWWRLENKYCILSTKGYWITQRGRAVQKFTREITGYRNTSEFQRSIELFYLARGNAQPSNEDIRYRVDLIEPTVDQLLYIQRGYNANLVLNCPGLLDDIPIQTTRGEVPKLEYMLSLIQDKYKESSIYIYCFNKEAQWRISDGLAEIGITSRILNGETPTDERQELIRLFNGKQVQVLISNVKRSLDLAGGDICIYYTVPSNPASVEQVKGRIDRHIDNNPKQFIALVYKHTPEEALFNKSVKRGEWSQSLLGTEKTAIDHLAAVYNSVSKEKQKGTISL